MCRTAAVLRSFLLVISGTDNAEANAVVLAIVVAVLVVHLAVVVASAVAATTETAEVAEVRVNIPTPLPDVAAHVI